MMRKKRLGMADVVLLMAAIMAVCFIWGNSMVPGAESDAISISFRNFLAEKLRNISWITVPGNAVVRKMAHVFEFAVLGVLLTSLIKSVMRVSYGWVLLAGMTAALTDETIQLFTGSRTSSVKDVWIDMSGFTAGVIIMMFIMALWHALRR